MSADLSIDERRAILEQQRKQWLSAQFDVESAIEVHQRIGSDKQQIDALVSQATRCTSALRVLAEKIAELGSG